MGLPPPPPATPDIPHESVRLSDDGETLFLGEAETKLPTENKDQRRVVLLSLMGKRMLSANCVAKALGVTPGHARKLKQALQDGDVAAVLDKRAGQVKDYRVDEQAKAQLIEQFVVDLVTRGRTSASAVARRMGDVYDRPLPERTVRSHLHKLGLASIKESLLTQLRTVKKKASKLIRSIFGTTGCARGWLNRERHRAEHFIHQIHCVGFLELAWTLGVDASTVLRARLYVEQLAEPATPHDWTPLNMTQQSQIIAFYCQTHPPGRQRWSLRTASKFLNEQNPGLIGRPVAPSTIQRVLKRHHLRPHRRYYFCHVRDAFFFEKMAHVLALYRRNHEHLYCFDECPNVQAVSRLGPDAPNPSGSVSREHQYARNGTIDIFGFLQVCTGKTDAYCRPGHDTLTLIEVFTLHVEARPKDARLYYVCDNLSPHFNEAFCRRVAELSGCDYPAGLKTGADRRAWLQSENKRIVICFLPFHGSWLNQVEIWFGLLKRYVLDDAWFKTVDDLIENVLMFTEDWNEHYAHPFNFNYTGEGLHRLVLRRTTRILTAQLDQIDAKFIADVCPLMERLLKHHSHELDTEDWTAFAEAFRRQYEGLEGIVANDPGPRRRRRARLAFESLAKVVGR